MSLYDAIARYYAAETNDFAEDVQFYRELARRLDGPLLDAMCGAGRVLLPLAEAGYRLTGVDLSQPMLDIARERLAAAELAAQVTLLQGDICSVELPAESFALAFVAVNSFMHLERVKDQLAALQTLRHALQRDGLLVLDLFNPNPAHLASEDNRLVLERIYRVDGRQVMKFVASESDMATQVSTMTYLFDELDETGRIARQMVQFRLRWLYRYELEHLLARGGFMLRGLHGSYDLDEYTSASERMIALATPRAPRSA